MSSLSEKNFDTVFIAYCMLDTKRGKSTSEKIKEVHPQNEQIERDFPNESEDCSQFLWKFCTFWYPKTYSSQTKISITSFYATFLV